MSAIITRPFKKQLAQTVFNEVANTTNRYYIGIGRSEQWDSAETVPTPIVNDGTIRSVRHGLQSVKSTTDISYVVPRYNWSSGSLYQGYDDTFTGIPDINPYAVLTEDNQVYMCLQQAKNTAGTATTSTVKPDGVSTKPFKTSDGYVWKFLYTLTAARASAFLSANFLPCEKVLDSSRHNDLVDPGAALPPLTIQQALVQDSAVPGQIIGIALTSGGSGFTSTPDVVITGDGVRATATATVVNQVITKIELDSSTDSAIAMGQGYNFASISFTNAGGGTGASARAIIGPSNGLGADSRDDLLSSSLMFNTKPNGIEDSNFIVGQNFRQVALIKDPNHTSDSAADGPPFATSSGKVLRSLKLNATANANLLNTTIVGQASGAKAFVDEVDEDRIYFHQTTATGFGTFQEAEVIIGGGISATLETAGADADAEAFERDDVDKLSGEILYIENRAPVTRSINQQEDLKVVITL